MNDIHRAHRSLHVPVVLSRDKVARLLSALDGTAVLMASLLYGAGLRLMECVRLRVQDAAFFARGITVRPGKGGKDRRTVLSGASISRLREQMTLRPSNSWDNLRL